MIMKTIDENPYIDESVKEIIRQFDALYFAGDIVAIQNNIVAAKKLAEETASIMSKINLYYSIATGFGDIRHISSPCFDEATLIEQLFYFRKAIDYYAEHEFSAAEMPYIAGCMIKLFTNYANSLSALGRTIEAIKTYKMALSIHKNFGMAEGNIGIAYINYADIEYDKGHSQIFHYVGYQYLKSAIKHKESIAEQEAIAFFQSKIDIFAPEYIQGYLEKELNLKAYSLGRKRESTYRIWVMNHGLFLNTMNDLPFADSFIAADTLHLPNMIRKTAEGFDYKHHGLFNQIKQEYITARYLIFESTQDEGKLHYADKKTILMDTLDYTIYSIRTEKMKLAFRCLYSVFDKIAFFLNDYFALEIPVDKVTYRKIWNKEPKTKLMSNPNIMLEALYWISKEFFDKDIEDQISIKPQARRIYEIRQSLEHKYLKLTMFDMEQTRKDSLAYYVSYTEFERETMELVRLAREAIIYLSLSVHINETHKRRADPDKIYMEMPLYEFDDEFKL